MSMIRLDQHEVEVLTEWCRNKPEEAAVELLALRKRKPEEFSGGCWCMACDAIKRARSDEPLPMRMNLCPDCGNKRCPRATNHLYDCTGSNEPGQPGSAY